VDPGALALAEGAIAEAGLVLDDGGQAAAVRTVALFTAMVGAVSAELFGHLVHVTADDDRAFDVVVATTAAGAGLHVDLG